MAMLFFEKKAEPITLLPERLREVTEFVHICNALGSELDKGNALIADKTCDVFVQLAGTDGMSRWEKILGVFTPLDSSIKARREAVLAKLITKPPINLAVLKDVIEAYMGVEAEISVIGHRITVKYRGESRIADLTPLFVTIYNIIPASMIASISYKYLVWSELDGVGMDFNDLDALNAGWQYFEKGEWVDG